MAVSYLDCASVEAMPTYCTSMSGFAFSKSAMISFQIAVRTPPFSSQNTIFPVPEPSAPFAPAMPLPSSPQAVAVRARAETRDIAAARRLLRGLTMVGSLL